jgi:glycosyltransferase involved in cell wall biosynthesis
MFLADYREKFLLIFSRLILKNKKSQKPLISVIIATYNRGEILCNRTIPSILTQTYPYFEIVIVGDCVTDNTERLLKKIDDNRIRFKNLKKRTVYPSDPIDRWMVAGATPRNIALSMIKGDWVYTISDDDMLMPDCFEKMINYVNRNKEIESVSASYLSYVQGIEKIFTASDVEKRLGIYMTGIPSWMYRSNLRFFKWNLNSWRKNWNRPSDYDLQHRMKKAGVRMGYFDEVVAISPPVSGTSLTGSQAVLYLSRMGKYD